MPPLCLRDYALVGLSHKTAPVEVRERLAIVPSELAGFLAALRDVAGADELMLVSTCNRVEAYAFGGMDAPELLRQALVSRACPESPGCFYVRRGADALAHLFRVASSLDSMILGEAQVLGQVKEAFAASKEAGTVGTALDHACQAAFAAAKRVRTETGIGASPVSMASAAVELARKVFGGQRGRTVLLIGAGKMSELTAKQLAADGSTVLVTNRTLERAEALAVRVGGVARPFSALPELLVEADIVVSSTAAPAPILGVAMLEPVVRQRHYRPLFLVDLAVPRDIEPEVGRLENVFAYDVDDLGRVVAEGREARAVEAGKAERIVEAELERFVQGRRVRGTVPVLALLRARAEQIASAEAQRTLAEFGEAITPRQRRSVEAMARAILNKLLHEPTLRLREAATSGQGEASGLAASVAELFGLEATGAGADAETRAQRRSAETA